MAVPCKVHVSYITSKGTRGVAHVMHYVRQERGGTQAACAVAFAPGWKGRSVHVEWLHSG